MRRDQRCQRVCALFENSCTAGGCSVQCAEGEIIVSAWCGARRTLAFVAVLTASGHTKDQNADQPKLGNMQWRLSWRTWSDRRLMLTLRAGSALQCVLSPMKYNGPTFSRASSERVCPLASRTMKQASCLLGGPGRREEFELVDHRTIADPRLQAAQGQRCDADLRRKRDPGSAGDRHCRGLSACGPEAQSLRRLIEARRGLTEPFGEREGGIACRLTPRPATPAAC